ncbi:MAG TPA: bifunctional rhamnulose-1-phosphate aldolase/short-chain dehydrogenase [Fimbriimonadaceae bacterium]|nr:bifunctional rhamnulose-1-phosphate aldolase/short-chain dehydrogenase [Fimbriimonadaceae bacterium]
MGEVDLLVYASNLLGSDPRITNFGGGNTSSKVLMTDPLTGQEVEVLWVKGSGGDLGTATRSNFASLYLDKVLGLEQKVQAEGLHEDEVVPLYSYCTFGRNPTACSIDTPLHAFVPARAVAHMHSDAVIAVAASEDAERLVQDIYGGEMGFLPWKRPGFKLGLMLRDLIRDRPRIHSVLLGSHGFINWADTWEDCYRLTLRLIDQAAEYIDSRRKGRHVFGELQFDRGGACLPELVPRLRGRVSHEGLRLIAHLDTSPAVRDFASRARMPELARMGTSCPDHFLRTKIRPLVLEDSSLEGMERALAAFRAEYWAYYQRCRRSDSPPMRNPNPSVVLLPGVGMISFGKSKQEARVTGEFYRNAIAVMEGAETISRYTALPEQEAFDIEYWQLEEAKLRRQPPERELSRRIALVVGAGPGIGQAIAEKLLQAGASVVVADLNPQLVDTTTRRLQDRHGTEVVAGEVLDISNRESVSRAMESLVLRFGGLDILINLAAVFIPPSKDGRHTDEQWHKTYAVNVVGSYLVADVAAQIMLEQGTPSSMVLVGSANAVVAKKGSVAYDTSKAALNHLVRELAVEYAPLIRVNAVAPATVVDGSQMFPRERVIASLEKYELGYMESESDEELRARLAQFYAKRTLLKQAVTAEKVAEAAFLLAGDRLGQTTGQIVPVDAGLPEAFLR